MGVYWYSRLGSTNVRAAELARARELDVPSITLTGWQVTGRGRGTNTWWSSTGSLTVTVALPSHASRPAHQLPLLVGVIVRRTIAAATGVEDVMLKWPNDLLHHDRKLGGLLCERVNGVDLIGLGLNVNLNIAAAPPLLRERITSLSNIIGKPVDQTEMLLTLIRALVTELDRPREWHDVLGEYNRHHFLTGRQISVSNFDHPQISGFCIGLDPDGRLILKSGNKLHHIISGHIEYVGHH